ncbi:hydroxyquinol 1,2-dioxygenase [Paraburkholderia sp. SARCC-3016]|uniref:hydroxyquinol 1,2-dioxygenase n=1 Tax=Paraburkholderia sp. SARCC-3016 TaxID=3058611 RepID=UPI00280A27BD|nr:hydroxyquinol 1,2-dioxygenase [Paraburkholderia sp. SARCC-3016]MDQ7977929.1 hydroxyquinol 1,2-dioxygenase [Paraburkholderia sp. SARCC-3016]
MQQRTWLASLDNFKKGTIETVNGSAAHFAMSNVFEVASGALPYEKVVVGRNLDYVIEVLRAHRTSAWFAAAHDEFAIVLDGTVDVQFVKAAKAPLVEPSTQGSVRFDDEPQGQSMGYMRLRRGHQALLPAGAAYRFVAVNDGVLLLQTMLGQHSVQKWAEICIR